jgi:hypothetical protein
MAALFAGVGAIGLERRLHARDHAPIG